MDNNNSFIAAMLNEGLPQWNDTSNKAFGGLQHWNWSKELSAKYDDIVDETKLDIDMQYELFTFIGDIGLEAEQHGYQVGFSVAMRMIFEALRKDS